MNEVYILIIIKEAADTHPEVQVVAYRDMDSALKAYDVSIDEARTEAEDYEFPHEEREICTDSYRWFRIVDLHDVSAITVEVQTKEIIADGFDDI